MTDATILGKAILGDTSVVSPKRIAVVASLTLSLINFRFQLLKSMAAAGHKVTAFAPDEDEDTIGRLREAGIDFVRIPIGRTGTNPIADLRTLSELIYHFRRVRPDVLLPYTMKPIIYGLIAGRIAGVTQRYALVTGLGHVFAEGAQDWRRPVLRAISIVLYRIAMVGVRKVFVYNSADEKDLLQSGIVRDPNLLHLVPGSGVDLSHFAPTPPPLEPITFLVCSRLLRDKGILHYVEAARRLQVRYPEARFQLLGPIDVNPTAITEAEIRSWVAEGTINYLGETRDVRPALSACTVFVLPSYYREGIPRSLLEALSSGRAIVTTENPGCRETVEVGVNGFLVPPHDSRALAAAMETFIKDPGLAISMGGRSRELATRRFDVNVVNRMLLTQMDLV